MKVLRFTLAVCLVLAMAMATACVAQVTQPQQTQQTMRARVEAGPVVRAGMPASADVFVGERFAMRIPASAGGMSPMRRAQTITERLNRAFDQGMSWQDTRVSQVGGIWAVTIGNMIIATADINSARAYRISTGELASRWARQTVVAMGGQPQVIAMQLRPVPVEAQVAGAREELVAANWMTSPTKSVPLLSASDGSLLGNVMVAGASDRLNLVNAVAVYESSSDGTIVRTFVPITGTSVAGPVTRVQGVGLVSMPSDLLNIPGLMMGSNVMQMVTQMGVQWNRLINTGLAQDNLQTIGNTRVVPLYSADEGMVIGAAQIVGSASAIANAQAVVVSSRDNMLMFSATSSSAASITPQSAMLNNVVVSAIMFMPQADMMSPGVSPANPGENTEMEAN